MYTVDGSAHVYTNKMGLAYHQFTCDMNWPTWEVVFANFAMANECCSSNAIDIHEHKELSK